MRTAGTGNECTNWPCAYKLGLETCFGVDHTRIGGSRQMFQITKKICASPLDEPFVALGTKTCNKYVYIKKID